MKLVTLLLVIAAVPGACWPEARFYGRIAVWNRTTEAITIVAPGPAAPSRDEIRVEPCGHATRDRFLTSDFEVLDSAGTSRVIVHGGAGPDPAHPEPLYMVVAVYGREVGAELFETPPAELPPCR